MAVPLETDQEHPHAHWHWPGPENDGSLASRFEDYLMSGTTLMKLNDFAQKYAKQFEVVDGEHPHEWHEWFQEYAEMLDGRIDAFLASESVTAEQAVAQCFTAVENGKEKYQYFLYVAAALDYQRFYELMLDFKSGRRDLSRWWTCLAVPDGD
eukprot:TRINITY_DN9178_c0_g1_i2.p1 TRINITY_DN9178_c0_g1~~TRINITY_DN9178_c0_g1_i2.p1  ORF type:complete len:153 (+),score=31.95 TRINITY_DN9178_c0_g1_i2:61-519(+)